MDTHPTNAPERNQELIDRLIRLCQIDIDASFAYETALDFIESDESHPLGDETITKSLERFRDDHDDHVFTLSSAIYGFGGEPPDISLDWKGFVLEGYTTVSSITGAIGALQALKVDEQVIRDSYEEAMKWDVPNALHRLLEENWNDEQRHLSFIADLLERFERPEVEEEDENAEVGIDEREESEERPPTMRF